MRRREMKPQVVESLEGRAVPSALAPQPPSGVVALMAQGHSIQPSGTIRGTLTVQRGIPDVGNTDVIRGQGRLRTLGQVQASGSVQTTGFIAVGRAEGSLRLTGAKGSVTLVLQGPKQSGFGPLPDHFQYVIQGGTGALAKATGSGTVDVVHGSRPGQITLVIH
jgi:hypothetical protein